MSGTYKRVGGRGWGGQWGRVSGGGGWADGGRLYPLLGLFGVANSPRSTSYWP